MCDGVGGGDSIPLMTPTLLKRPNLLSRSRTRANQEIIEGLEMFQQLEEIVWHQHSRVHVSSKGDGKYLFSNWLQKFGGLIMFPSINFSYLILFLKLVIWLMSSAFTTHFHKLLSEREKSSFWSNWFLRYNQSDCAWNMNHLKVSFLSLDIEVTVTNRTGGKGSGINKFAIFFFNINGRCSKDDLRLSFEDFFWGTAKSQASQPSFACTYSVRGSFQNVWRWIH